MTVSQAVPIGLEMLAALAALHGRGIVHRDLKPSNVFLTPHGVKLLDFGLARPEPDETISPDADLTRPGFVMGTPRYMAPEQIAGDPVDGRGDLFAAAAILFEMLAGRPAFTGRTISDVLHATTSEQPPALTGSPGVAAVDRVIRRALPSGPRNDRLLRSRWPRNCAPPAASTATAPARSPERSRASSCCLFACFVPIRRSTSWPSACPTRSRRLCPASARSSCARAPRRPDSPGRRRTSRHWPRKLTSIASSWGRCCDPATSFALQRNWSKRPVARC